MTELPDEEIRPHCFYMLYCQDDILVNKNISLKVKKKA